MKKLFSIFLLFALLGSSTTSQAKDYRNPYEFVIAMIDFYWVQPADAHPPLEALLRFDVLRTGQIVNEGIVGGRTPGKPIGMTAAD